MLKNSKFLVFIKEIGWILILLTFVMFSIVHMLDFLLINFGFLNLRVGITTYEAIISAVAILSLYLAWKKWIYKSKPFLNFKLYNRRRDGSQTMVLNIINMGEKTIRLIRLGYVTVKEKKDFYLFQKESKYWGWKTDKKRLKPEKDINIKLGDNLIIVGLNEFSYEDYEGNRKRKDVSNEFSMVELARCKSSHQIPLQILFDKYHGEKKLPRKMKIPKENLDIKKPEDIIEKYSPEQDTMGEVLSYLDVPEKKRKEIVKRHKRINNE